MLGNDPSPDAPLSLAQATKLPQLARDGKPPHLATLWRWTSRGVKGIRLQATRVGGRVVVTRTAVDAFLRQLANPTERPTAGAVAAGHRSAEHALAAAGI